MDSPRRIIAEQARLVAAELPPEQVEAVARAIEAADASRWQEARGRILGSITHAHYRSMVAGLLDCWQAFATSLSPQAVAVALSTAAASEAAWREQTVDLAWTGPDAEAVPLRHTEQAILQVIDAAAGRLTVVSYAVYKIHRIAAAMIRAADRGVALTIILETPDRLEGQNAYDTLRALGDGVAARSRVYLWPPEKRPRDGVGKYGSLHVKCMAADGRWLFLSSANLTEYAFMLNMELGVLIKGGRLPGQVEAHFDRLVRAGIWRDWNMERTMKIQAILDRIDGDNLVLPEAGTSARIHDP